jgi:hypothetical protein
MFVIEAKPEVFDFLNKPNTSGLASITNMKHHIIIGTDSSQDVKIKSKIFLRWMINLVIG